MITQRTDLLGLVHTNLTSDERHHKFVARTEVDDPPSNKWQITNNADSAQDQRYYRKLMILTVKPKEIVNVVIGPFPVDNNDPPVGSPTPP